MDTLGWIIAGTLTSRQADILLLYYAAGLTEAQIAAVLKITQPTVSQHLTGKRRRGKKVGGALRKLRKGIHRAATRKDLSARERQVVAVLNSLLEESFTRRAAARLFGSLRDAP